MMRIGGSQRRFFSYPGRKSELSSETTYYSHEVSDSFCWNVAATHTWQHLRSNDQANALNVINIF